MQNRRKHRPRSLCDVGFKELQQAVKKMCRELKISPSLCGCYDLYKACEQERQKEIDRRLMLLEA